MIKTAKKYINENLDSFKDEDHNDVYMLWQVEEAMIEFAQLHTKEALKQTSENLRQASGSFNSDFNDQKRSILNAYNLDNIK